LEYHPDDKLKPETVEYENLIIEEWREKYEKYAKENSLFPTYFSLVRLFEEYYIETNHPFPKVVAYRQRLNPTMIVHIINKITKLEMEGEMKDELFYLYAMLDGNLTTPQLILIEKCNDHHLNNILKHENIIFSCPIHDDCIFKYGNNGCQKGATMYQVPIPDINNLSSGIRFFNIEMCGQDIAQYFIIENS